jgi:hypothetical protein
MTARRAGRAVAALVTGMMIAAVAACGSGNAAPVPAGPVPASHVPSGLSAGPLRPAKSGGRLVLAVASVGVDPGEPADGEAYLVNSGPAPVRVIRVSAVPVPGQRVPRLAHVAIATTGEGIAGARDWPPPVPVRPAAGALLARGQVGVVFGFTGSVPGRDYALAGVKIIYAYRGRRYSATGWAVEVACVSRNWRKPGPSAGCRTASDLANTAVKKMTGLPS